MVKAGGDNVVKNFEEKFEEMRVEGHRKENGSSASVMFTEEDEYFDDEEMEEECYEDDQEESQTESEEKEAYFMGTHSQARKRFNTPQTNTYRSRPTYRNRFNQRQSPYYPPNCD